MMNRKIAPELKNITSIDFIEPQILPVKGPVNLYFMKNVPNETARVDLYFDAGILRGKKGTSSFVNSLLLSGNAHISSTEISHQIDYLGAFFETGLTTENAVISLYSLRENMPELLRFVKKTMQEMDCQEKEVTEMVLDKKQNYEVNLQKTRYLAQREFQKRIFASDENYAKIVTPDYYENVDRTELFAFFQQHYLQGLTKITVVGQFESSQVDEFIALFQPWCVQELPQFISEIKNEPGYFQVEKKEALQCALRVGRILFNKKHKDYHDFTILNTLLGDYFGSRLMTNIREDKGYTYGIGSTMAEYTNFGYFMIGTEVAKEVKEATLKEIQNEFDRLKEEKVSAEELDLVKNYMLGQLLKSADGPYSMLDLYLSAQAQEKNLSFYNEAIQSIQSITPERIQALANQYLLWEEMSIVTAG